MSLTETVGKEVGSVASVAEEDLDMVAEGGVGQKRDEAGRFRLYHDVREKAGIEQCSEITERDLAFYHS